MKLSIIIPVFNEKKTIGAVLEKLSSLDLGPPSAHFGGGGWEKEIIAVDDGSTDGSKKIIEEYLIPPEERVLSSLPHLLTKERGVGGVRLVFHPKNLGKGAAIKTGLAQSTGDAVIIQDADLEYNPSDWIKMLEEFESGKYEAIYGSRNLNPERQGYPHYVLGVAILSELTNILYRSKLTDVYTCYKLIKTDVLKNLKIESNGFEFEAEVTAKILKSGRKIKEIPISYNPRRFSEGKKIRFKDALIGFWTIIKNRF